ncbi:MAG TPA: bacillithiol biosynthesis BshC, partial [Rhodothermales bacterium]|nr:bacillithiol biosynthesis BshC [Rhodothermales bacterium]
QDFEQLFQQVVVGQMDVDVDALFGTATGALHDTMNGLKQSVQVVDKTLAGSVDATRTALIKELEKLKGRVVKAEKRNQESVRVQLEKASASLFPAGKLQERALTPLYFLNKYGPDFLAHLQQTLSLDTTAHQVVQV